MTTKLTNANILNVDSSKVTNLEVGYDDNDLLNDLSTIALRQASNEDKEAYYTASMYIDVFQDSSGITNLVNTTRDAGEFVSSGANTTGSFESNAITVSGAVSSMGVVMTYQDNTGTNILNTDIIVKLSADNGVTYSTATLEAMPNFATDIKMCKTNDLSVTSGTSLKYKIEFANQSAGSKEARIRGVSFQY